MKHPHRIYHSEKQALTELVGEQIIPEKIKREYHHKDRVVMYPGTGIAKKIRPATERCFLKSVNEANAHVDLKMMGVNVPEIYGIIKSEEENSILTEYIEADTLMHLMHVQSPEADKHIARVGDFIGKMYENKFLHGDLVSYHVFANGATYIFDFESTQRFNHEDFFLRLPGEWKRFVGSTQGRRWYVPFIREQEEILFESARKNMSRGRTLDVIESVLLRKT